MTSVRAMDVVVGGALSSGDKGDVGCALLECKCKNDGPPKKKRAGKKRKYRKVEVHLVDGLRLAFTRSKKGVVTPFILDLNMEGVTKWEPPPTSANYQSTRLYEPGTQRVQVSSMHDEQWKRALDYVKRPIDEQEKTETVKVCDGAGTRRKNRLQKWASKSPIVHAVAAACGITSAIPTRTTFTHESSSAMQQTPETPRAPGSVDEEEELRTALVSLGALERSMADLLRQYTGKDVTIKVEDLRRGEDGRFTPMGSFAIHLQADQTLVSVMRDRRMSVYVCSGVLLFGGRVTTQKRLLNGRTWDNNLAAKMLTPLLQELRKYFDESVKGIIARLLTERKAFQLMGDGTWDSRARGKHCMVTLMEGQTSLVLCGGCTHSERMARRGGNTMEHTGLWQACTNLKDILDDVDDSTDFKVSKLGWDEHVQVRKGMREARGMFSFLRDVEIAHDLWHRHRNIKKHLKTACASVIQGAVSVTNVFKSRAALADQLCTTYTTAIEQETSKLYTEEIRNMPDALTRGATCRKHGEVDPRTNLQTTGKRKRRSVECNCVEIARNVCVWMSGLLLADPEKHLGFLQTSDLEGMHRTHWVRISKDVARTPVAFQLQMYVTYVRWNCARLACLANKWPDMEILTADEALSRIRESFTRGYSA